MAELAQDRKWLDTVATCNGPVSCTPGHAHVPGARLAGAVGRTIARGTGVSAAWAEGGVQCPRAPVAAVDLGRGAHPRRTGGRRPGRHRSSAPVRLRRRTSIISTPASSSTTSSGSRPSAPSSRSAPRPTSLRRSARQTDPLLGQCYEHLDEPDRQLDAYARAWRSIPLRCRVSARRRRWRAGPDCDEARVEYEQLMALPDAPRRVGPRWPGCGPSGTCVCRLPAQNWQAVEDDLAHPSGIRRSVHSAYEALVGQGNSTRLTHLLQDECTRDPKRVVYGLPSRR